MNAKKKNKMEYGYISQKKKTLLLQMVGNLAVGVAVFLLGLLLNKGELTNIFTVVAILFVIPAARYLTVWIVLFPYHTASREEYEEVRKLAEGHGLLLTDLVFTSAERPMSLDYMVLAGGQAYCYLRPETKEGQKQDADKREKRSKLVKGTENYLNAHFAEKKFSMKAKIFEDYDAFRKAVLSHELREGELEEQEKVKDSMAYFMV